MTWGLIALAVWLYLGLSGTYTLYVGYGFVMAAQNASNLGLTQAKVAKIDRAIAFRYILLDAYLNLAWVSFLSLDFRKQTTWNLVTGRLCIYNSPGYGLKAPKLLRWWYAYHIWLATFVAAFLDGKDISDGYIHIKGVKRKFNWLD